MPPERLDRWRTLNLFVTEGQAVHTAAFKSPAAAVVWFTLFALADGRTGVVKGASVVRLAALTGLTRPTVRKAVLYLLKAGAMTRAAGRGRVPEYALSHVPAKRDRDKWCTDLHWQAVCR